MKPILHCALMLVTGLALQQWCLASDDPNAPAVRVEIRLIQFSTRTDDAAAASSAKDAAAAEKLNESSDGMAVYVAPRDKRVVLNGLILLPQSAAPPAPTSQPAAGDPPTPHASQMEAPRTWTIAAPTILCLVGQSASVCVAQAIPFMTMRDDASLVVVERAGVEEGLRIGLKVSEASDAAVRLDDCTVNLSRMVGREPIPGVPFDVGRPILKTIAATAALRLAPDQVAIIALTPNDEQPIYTLISARLER